MDVKTGKIAAETAMDLVKNENVLSKATGLMGMLCPFVAAKQKAVDVYIKEIEKSNLPADTKVILLLNVKKHFKELKNQESIAKIAIENAKPGTDFSENSSVNEEWFNRFMDSAKFVSSEDIQLIWGKILANEFEKPGSTPPNMIRILSEITPELAKAFSYICSMEIWILPLNDNGDFEEGFKRVFVPYHENDEKFRKIGINFNVLNELETLGVIKFESIGGYITKGITNEKLLICIKDKLEVIEKYKKGEIPIGNVMLTSVGNALQTIIESIEIEGYYEMIKEYMIKNGIVFAKEHEYILENNGAELVIKREYCNEKER